MNSCLENSPFGRPAGWRGHLGSLAPWAWFAFRPISGPLRRWGHLGRRVPPVPVLRPDAPSGLPGRGRGRAVPGRGLMGPHWSGAPALCPPAGNRCSYRVPGGPAARSVAEWPGGRARNHIGGAPPLAWGWPAWGRRIRPTGRDCSPSSITRPLRRVKGLGDVLFLFYHGGHRGHGGSYLHGCTGCTGWVV